MTELDPKELAQQTLEAKRRIADEEIARAAAEARQLEANAQELLPGLRSEMDAAAKQAAEAGSFEAHMECSPGKTAEAYRANRRAIYILADEYRSAGFGARVRDPQSDHRAQRVALILRWPSEQH